MSAISRNAPCPCGSGKKYKRCCGMAQTSQASVGRDQSVNKMGLSFQQAIQFYNQGNFQAAKSVCNQLLIRDPKDLGALEMLGVILLQLGDWNGASKTISRQLKHQPKNPLLHCNLGLALHELGNDEQAYIHCKKAISLEPKLTEAYNNIGKIHQKRNNLQDAFEYYQKAIDLGNQDPHVFVNAGLMRQLLGDLSGAEAVYRQVTTKWPEFLPAHNNLGAVLQKQRKHEEAKASFAKVLKHNPKDPEAHNNMGITLLECGEVDSAVEYFQRALEISPDYVGAHINLGYIYGLQNKDEDCEKFYQAALALDPENASVHANLGYRFYQAGDLVAAKSHFEKSLTSDPNSVDALSGLGEVEVLRERLDLAEKYINRAVKLGPYESTSHRAMAALHQANHNFTSATNEWLKVIELAPIESAGYIGAAKLYFSQDRFEDAREMYRRCEAKTSGSVNLYHAWSRLEEHTHNLEIAEMLAEKATLIDPHYPGMAIIRSTLARRRKDFESALEILNEVDHTKTRRKEMRANYLFEKGNVLDKLGRYNEAITAYKEANELKNDYLGTKYEEEKDARLSKNIKSVFRIESIEPFQHLAKQLDTPNPMPLFIVGFPRSGTSLLEQILGSHHQVAPAGELTFIQDLAVRQCKNILGSNKGYPLCLSDDRSPLDEAMLRKMRDYYLSGIGKYTQENDQVKWVTDKMPHNSLHLGLISMLFPEAPIIHISRHPLDSCLSAYFSNFGGHRYTSSLESTATHYQHVMDTIEYYKEVLPMRFIEIRYQDLVDDQEAVVRKLLDFIGAPWDENCLQHHKSNRVVRTASYEQVTQKVYRSSLARYQNYWEAVQPLIPIVKPTIERFGYPLDKGSPGDT